MFSSGNRWTWIVVLALALVAVAPAAAQSQDGNPVAMRPGNIDVGATGGLSGLVYPYLEPQVAIGLVPLGPVTLSAGAVADVGYCLLCSLLQIVDNNWRLRSYYFGAYGRVLAHLDILSDVLGPLRLDPYVGLAVGPRFYLFGLEYRPTSESVTASASTVIIAPQAGARVFLRDGSNWFGFAEIRYQFEVGFQTQTVQAGGQSFTITGDYSSGGSNVGFGVGLRL